MLGTRSEAHACLADGHSNFALINIHLTDCGGIESIHGIVRELAATMGVVPMMFDYSDRLFARVLGHRAFRAAFQ